MGWSHRKLAAVGAIAIAAFAGAGAALTSSGGRPADQATSIVGGLGRIGPLAHGTIHFAFNLRLREGQLGAYLRHVNPGGSSGGRMTAAQFGTRFGPSDDDLARLRSILHRLGIAVAHVYPQRTAMLVSLSVARMNRLFSLRFARYVLPDGQRFVAPEKPPRIPTSLVPYVTGLGDLSTRPTQPADIPTSGLTPALTDRAYDIAALHSAGIRGQGQTIAVATLNGSVNPADLQEFARSNGIPPFNIQLIPVDGGSTYNPRAGSDSEADLDLQVILGIAPAARILDYQVRMGPRARSRGTRWVTSTTGSSRTARPGSSRPVTACARAFRRAGSPGTSNWSTIR